MKILVLRTWLTNIGNGFIDEGAIHWLKLAYPDAEISSISGYNHYAAYKKSMGGLSEISKTFELLETIGKSNNNSIQIEHLDLSRLMEFDLAVLPGCVLYQEAIEPYYQMLNNLKERDIPVLILGGGGMTYDDETKSYVKDRLQELEVDGLISRDKVAYDTYRDDVPFCSRGVDCAFFINRMENPRNATREFNVKLFDKIQEPSIDLEGLTVRPSHSPFGYTKPYKGKIAYVFKTKSTGEILENNFESDRLEDYLFLYANASETHSDRIHACVPAIVFGNKARFYFDTPREMLFEELDLMDIKNQTVTLSPDSLERAQRENVSKLKSIVNQIEL